MKHILSICAVVALWGGIATVVAVPALRNGHIIVVERTSNPAARFGPEKVDAVIEIAAAIGEAHVTLDAVALAGGARYRVVLSMADGSEVVLGPMDAEPNGRLETALPIRGIDLDRVVDARVERLR
jgi:hypothetical protein